MATIRFTRDDRDSIECRRRAGFLLKSLRVDSKLTQTDVAEALGSKYYTFISQVERGSARLPWDSVPAFAKLTGVDTRKLTHALLSLYDPVAYQLLEGGSPNTKLYDTLYLAVPFEGTKQL